MIQRTSARLLMLAAAALVGTGVAAPACSASFISYSFSATNPTGGAVPFAVDFFLPVTPFTSAVMLTDTITSVTLTDANGDGVTISPSGSLTLQDGVLDGTSFIGVGGTLSGGPGDRGATYLFGPLTETSVAGPFGSPVSTIEIDLSFLLSGGGDSAAFTGRFEVTPVPEPAALPLLLAGGGALAAGPILRARRRGK